MASTGVNVIRWSALALGIVYGLSHQSSITAKDKAAAAQAEFDRKARLISQAKQEWRREHPAPAAPSGGGDSKKQLDGNENDFDIETYLHLKD